MVVPAADEAGDAAATWPLDEVDGPAREEEREGGAEEAEQRALGEELADEAAAGGAESRAHGELAASRHGVRQEDVGHVGAGDDRTKSAAP
jgi:hypothetical protein